MNRLYTAIVLFAFILGLAPALAQTPPAKPRFVNSKDCASCHKSEHEQWKSSHHAWALKAPDENSMLGDFGNTVFSHNGETSRFFRQDGKYFVEVKFTNSETGTFEIKYAVGVTPLQQYLVELEGGKLQALDVAWDTEHNQWFHLYPDQTLAPDDGLHWTGPYKNWSARCATCHQTDFKKNYNPRNDTYASRWSEATVTCQACHGPAEAHLEWAREPAAFAAGDWVGVNDLGFIQDFSEDSPNKEIELCAQCHSRRGGFSADSPAPASRFADYHRLALLTDGLYHADGQIDDEVYVYGSFLQSKMYDRGVRCTDCHEPHGGNLKAEGNAVCTQCHSEAGNERFPTLTKKSYDDPSHHHHETGTAGAQCVSCHMPAKNYMQVDPRRDHSFRIPRPDVTARIGTPNACASCHQDKRPDQLVEALVDWLGTTPQPGEHYGEIIQAGRTQPGGESFNRLVDLAKDTSKPAIVRATAIITIQAVQSPDAIDAIAPFLKDESHLVRSAALRILDLVPAPRRAELAFALLSDPVRAVRVEAARLFVTIPPQRIPSQDRRTVANAMVEYQRSLFANADFPEVQMQLAGLAMTTRQFPAAQQALKTAIQMDPQLVPAWQTLARIQAALGQPGEAVSTMESARESNSDNADIEFQLGVLYAQTGQHAQAVEALENSIDAAPDRAQALELIAISHLRSGAIDTAAAKAEQLRREHPGHTLDPLLQQILNARQ